MKRYLSLDILRGITVAFMCVVNNPGSWGKIFAPLRHAPWSGCTPTDLVYPFFIFCMGVAMAFSFRKYDGLHKDGVKKVIYRGLALFGIGFLIGAYPFFPTSPHDPAASFGENWLYWIGHCRIFGVLQRIGMAYLIAGLLALWLRKPGKNNGRHSHSDDHPHCRSRGIWRCRKPIFTRRQHFRKDRYRTGGLTARISRLQAGFRSACRLRPGRSSRKSYGSLLRIAGLSRGIPYLHRPTSGMLKTRQTPPAPRHSRSAESSSMARQPLPCHRSSASGFL